MKKPSSSKSVYDFCLSASSLEQTEEIQVDANSQGIRGNEAETNPRNQGNKTKTNPSPSKPLDDNDGDNNDNKSESSTLDTVSSSKNIADLFALLELQDNVVCPISTVDSLDNIVAQLESKLDKKVSSLDSKLEPILKNTF